MPGASQEYMLSSYLRLGHGVDKQMDPQWKGSGRQIIGPAPQWQILWSYAVLHNTHPCSRRQGKRRRWWRNTNEQSSKPEKYYCFVRCWSRMPSSWKDPLLNSDSVLYLSSLFAHLTSKHSWGGFNSTTILWRLWFGLSNQRQKSHQWS